MMKALPQLPLRIGFSVLFSLMAFASFAFEISCPEDVTISCDDDIYDLSIYGTGQYKDYNGWHDTDPPSVYYNLDNCGLGTITRTFSATNPYNNETLTCSQIITVDGSNFGASNITWPLTGLELAGCNPDVSPSALPNGYQMPTWTPGTCAIIGLSYTDKVFNFQGACKKIVRTWEVINCCTFNPYTGEGIFKYNQEIDVTVSDVPDVTCPDNVTIASFDCQSTYVDVPGIIVPDGECTDQVVIMNDSPFAISPTDASGTYPIGTTTVTFTADYGCWQKTMCQVDVTVTDNTAPTPYCLYGLSIALMGIDTDNDGVNDEGMVEVWASDLDKGSFASCGSDSELTFSFSSDPTDNVREFTCDDVGRNNVEIWVTDDEGRQNFCNTYVRVQNNVANIEDCEDSDDFSRVSGHVMSHYGDPMGYMALTAVGTSHSGEMVEELTYSVEEIIYDSIINSTGTLIYYFTLDTVWSITEEMVYPTQTYETEQYTDSYMFEDLAHYHDYQIFGELEDPEHELINLADVVEIEAFIAGDTEFTAYQRMAADVNGDGSINEADVSILQAVLAGNAPASFDTKWRFFDSAMNVDNMDPDHECEEFCRVQDLSEDTYKVNLVGYRPGDVTQDVMLETETETTINQTLQFRGRQEVSAVSISPNPFVNNVVIELHTAKKDQGELILSNEVGQILRVIPLQIEAGFNTIAIDLEDIEKSGLLIYSIRIADYYETGKLVKLK